MAYILVYADLDKLFWYVLGYNQIVFYSLKIIIYICLDHLIKYFLWTQKILKY